jgi:hypothetical protein
VGRVVAVCVDVLRKDQNAARAKLNTKTAAFAAFLDHMDDAMWNLDTFTI